MLRRLLDRLNPTRGLPKPMRRYLGLPNRLLLIWLALTLLTPLAAAQLQRWGVIDLAPPTEAAADAPPVVEPEAQPEEVSDAGETGAAESGDRLADAGAGPAAGAPEALPLAEGQEIDVSGAVSFTLSKRGGRIVLAASGQSAMELAADGAEWRLRGDAGQTIYRLKIKDDEKGKLYDDSGIYRFRIKCETEEGERSCKLYDPAGNRLHRVKIKSDSFNVYGAGEDRLYKGKLKAGAYEVRDEAKRTVATIRGAGSLDQAALLSMPVDVPVRVLVWCFAVR